MMPWVKVTDDFWRNPKVRRAWRAHPPSISLYVMALSYCNEKNGLGEENDGFVDEGWITLNFLSLNGEGEAEARAAITTLVNEGLWEPFGDGWQIHDYLKYQPSSKEIQKRHEARRLAGALGAKARWGNSTRHSKRRGKGHSKGDS